MRFLDKTFLLATIFASLAASTAGAQTVDRDICLPLDADCRSGASGPASAKIDSKFRFLKHVFDAEGPSSPAFGPAGAPDDLSATGVGATLRFVDELPERVIADFEERGITFVRNDGELVHVGAIYRAQVDWTAFDFLAKNPLLVRAESTWSPITATPLEVTSETVGASYAQDLPDIGVDGDGVTVADIDSGFDILHPHLFRADGGYYTWTDANENGEFDPGQDTMDHNDDGTAEKLELLDASATVDYRDFQNMDGELQPRRDWVFLDINGDGKRNAGPNAGFDENDPAYGEPIFVVDDADRDGKVDATEKLVRLSTSKFKKVVFNGVEYVRGTNLIDYANPELNVQPGHGTGVASILGGGQKGFHDHVGLAPGVDILGYAYGGQDRSDGSDQNRYTSQIEAIHDAIDEGATLVLHEWTEIIWTSPDGSSNLEAAMDAAREQGVAQVNPLGNLSQSGKHVVREAETDQPVEFEFRITDGFRYGRDTYPWTSIYVSLMWRAGVTPRATLIAPDGTEHQLRWDEATRNLGAASVYSIFETSRRGTRHLGLALWRQDRESLQQGIWTIRLERFSTGDEITGRIADMYTSWNRGVAWEQPTDDYGTMVFPSTADSAFGVAAFAGRHERPSSAVGELRAYSGRGPRIDGERGVDIAAPDDPFAAMGINQDWLDAGYQRGWFRTFGGTSGAGPHVAAAVALLKQQNPDWTPDDIEAALQQSAQNDALAPDYGAYPNTHWGFGKLDVFDALYGVARPRASNQAPDAELVAVLEPASVIFDASQSADPDGDVVEYRFDFDYDGRWDTDWVVEPTASIGFGAFDTEQVVARVAVRDPNGNTSGDTVTFNLDDAPPHEVVVHESEEPSGDSGGCACDTGAGGSGSAAGLLAGLLALFGLRLRRQTF